MVIVTCLAPPSYWLRKKSHLPNQRGSQSTQDKKELVFTFFWHTRPTVIKEGISLTSTSEKNLMLSSGRMLLGASAKFERF